MCFFGLSLDMNPLRSLVALKRTYSIRYTEIRLCFPTSSHVTSFNSDSKHLVLLVSGLSGLTKHFDKHVMICLPPVFCFVVFCFR